MYFCKKCNYRYGYVKDVKNKQFGGKNANDNINLIFEKFANREPISADDLADVTGAELLKDDKYDKMNKKDQRMFVTVIKKIDKNFFVESAEESEQNLESTNIAYFACEYCNYHEPMTAGTVLYTKNYNNDIGIDTEDYSMMCHNYSLPRTRNYICHNKKCETHKNIDIREAVLTKNKADRIIYVCCVCSTNWVESN